MSKADYSSEHGLLALGRFLETAHSQLGRGTRLIPNHCATRWIALYSAQVKHAHCLEHQRRVDEGG